MVTLVETQMSRPRPRLWRRVSRCLETRTQVLRTITVVWTNVNGTVFIA